MRHRRRLVKGQPITVLFAFGTAKLSARNASLFHDRGNRWHRRRDDGFGRLHVLLQQERGNREHVADVVEAIAGVVGREFLGGLELNPHEIADGVAILHPVEPPKSDAPRVGILRIDPESLILDPIFQAPLFLFRRTRLLGRRHEAGPQVFQHGPPKVAFTQEFLFGLELIKRHVSFVHAIPMAVVAVFRENRLDVLAEMGCRLDLCARSARTKIRECRQSGRPCQRN